jgi:Protein of unknown function (DUF3309)
MSTILIVILILLLLGAFGAAPLWPHQGFGVGWGASGGLGLVFLILLILLVTGRL